MLFLSRKRKRLYSKLNEPEREDCPDGHVNPAFSGSMGKLNYLNLFIIIFQLFMFIKRTPRVVFKSGLPKFTQSPVQQNAY